MTTTENQGLSPHSAKTNIAVKKSLRQAQGDRANIPQKKARHDVELVPVRHDADTGAFTEVFISTG